MTSSDGSTYAFGVSIRNSNYWVADTDLWAVESLLKEERAPAVKELALRCLTPAGSQETKSIEQVEATVTELPKQEQDSIFTSRFITEAVKAWDVYQWIVVSAQALLSSVMPCQLPLSSCGTQNNAHPVVVSRGVVQMLKHTGMDHIPPEIINDARAFFKHLEPLIGKALHLLQVSKHDKLLI